MILFRFELNQVLAGVIDESDFRFADVEDALTLSDRLALSSQLRGKINGQVAELLDLRDVLKTLCKFKLSFLGSNRTVLIVLLPPFSCSSFQWSRRTNSSPIVMRSMC